MKHPHAASVLTGARRSLFKREQARGTSTSYFDYDNSDSLTLADYNQLRRRLIKRLI